MRKNYQEIRILRYCDHPNIIGLFRGTIYDGDMWIITEFVNGGTLTDGIYSNFTQYSYRFS